MRLLCVVLVVTGCKSIDDSFKVQPGGRGVPSSNGQPADAPVLGIDGFMGIAGRVCLLTDLRQLHGCAASGVAGLTVTVGAETATTSADGSFGISEPNGSNLEWHVTGATIMTSVMPFGTNTEIPAVAIATWTTMLQSNGVLEFAGQGDVIAAITNGTIPEIGVRATVAPAATAPPLYDGATAVAWNQNATGPFGVVWLPANAVGTIDATLTPLTGTATDVMFAVEDGSITFDTVVLP